MTPARIKILLALVILTGAGGGAIHLLSMKQPPQPSDGGPVKTRAGSNVAATPDTGPPPAAPPTNRKADIPDDITPDRAKKLLEDFFRSSPKLDDRKAFATALIQKLCKAGFSTGAWEIIPEERSKARSAMLREYFASAELPQRDLLAKIENMHSELSDAFGGYTSRFLPAELAAMLLSPELRNLMTRMGPDRTSQLQISWNVTKLLETQLRDDPTANAVVRGIAEDLWAGGQLADYCYVRVLSSDQSLDEFEMWEKLQSVKPVKDDEREEIREEMKTAIRRMILKNAPAAMDVLLASAPDRKESNMEKAVDYWLRDAPQGAADWYEKNISRLDPEDRDLVTTAYINQMTEWQDIDQVKAWIERIPDPAAKERASGKFAEFLEMIRLHEEKQKQQAEKQETGK